MYARKLLYGIPPRCSHPVAIEEVRPRRKTPSINGAKIKLIRIEQGLDVNHDIGSQSRRQSKWDSIGLDCIGV